MQLIRHPADKRGQGNYDWLTTRYSFSFAQWYDPARMGFGALRVINDDVIAPGAGFPPHSHRDMEIITLVTEGTLAHQDSIGNKGTVRAGEVQVMSAGTGITHAEYNASENEPLSLFQIWIEPKEAGGEPRYDQGVPEKSDDGLTTLVGPMGTAGVLGIRQDAWITRAELASGRKISYNLHDPKAGVYVFVIGGKLSVAGVELGGRDALGVSDTDSISLASEHGAEVLLFEVPMAA